MTYIKNAQKFEIISVILTALGKFIFYDFLNLRLLYSIILFSFWGIYIYWRVGNNKTILKEWGFRFDTFQSVLRITLPFGLLCIVSCFIVGYFLNTIHLHWHIIPITLLYPIFGTLQQFLIMALVAGNLQKQNIKAPYTILITSALFAILHYPEWWLILGTFVLAVFYTSIYLKKRNLYVLGLLHGILGAFFYYTVVNKDPFLEVFGPFV